MAFYLLRLCVITQRGPFFSEKDDSELILGAGGEPCGREV